MHEAGVPGYSSQGALGLFAPAGTPREIQEKVHADVTEILTRPDVRMALETRSFVIDNAGPAEFAQTIAAEAAKWGPVIKGANIKGD
jgi:tripartite-type tricarboxylate transporter receptor subunit TctC